MGNITYNPCLAGYSNGFFLHVFDVTRSAEEVSIHAVQAGIGRLGLMGMPS